MRGAEREWEALGGMRKASPAPRSTSPAKATDPARCASYHQKKVSPSYRFGNAVQVSNLSCNTCNACNAYAAATAGFASLTFFSQSPPSPSIFVYFETCGSALTGRRPAMMWKRPRRRTFRREALPTRSQGQVHRTTHMPQLLQALRRPACFFSEPTLSSRFCFF